MKKLRFGALFQGKTEFVLEICIAAIESAVFHICLTQHKEELQNILNDHASKGWRLKSASVNQFANILSSSERDEMILIFERKKEYKK